MTSYPNRLSTYHKVIKGVEALAADLAWEVWVSEGVQAASRAAEQCPKMTRFGHFARTRRARPSG